MGVKEWKLAEESCGRESSRESEVLSKEPIRVRHSRGISGHGIAFRMEAQM